MAKTLRQFDAAGKLRTIDFSYKAVLRMAAAGFDVRDIRQAEKALADIEPNRFLLTEVLIASINPDDVEEFRNAMMDGKVADEAYNQLVEAVLDFFPKLRPVLDALKKRLEVVAEQVRKDIEAGQMDSLLLANWTAPSGSTQAESASTPQTSP